MSAPPPQPPQPSGRLESGDLAPYVALTTRVTDTLPAGAPAVRRRATYRLVLSAVVHDRVENGTGELEDGDEASLVEFVNEATELAIAAPDDLRDDAYEIVLEALLKDWVDNWNESDFDEDDDDL